MKGLFALAPVACFVFAGILCFYGKDGWGWFLIAGVVCTSAVVA